MALPASLRSQRAASLFLGYPSRPQNLLPSSSSPEPLLGPASSQLKLDEPGIATFGVLELYGPWVEPLLYRTLVIEDTVIDGLPACDMQTFNRIIQTKSPAFLADAVRNVMLRYLDTYQVHAILSACPGIEQLYLLYAPPSNDPTLTLPVPSLRHLYCPPDVFDLYSMDPFVHTMLAHITHLELFHYPDPMPDITLGTRLSVLPHLTHLALNLDHEMIWVCVQALAECKCLRVLVVFCQPEWQEEARHAGLEVLASDVRGVMMSLWDYLTDWQRGILTGNDYWARAEALIAKRILGEVDPDLSVHGMPSELPHPQTPTAFIIQVPNDELPAGMTVDNYLRNLSPHFWGASTGQPAVGTLLPRLRRIWEDSPLDRALLGMETRQLDPESRANLAKGTLRQREQTSSRITPRLRSAKLSATAGGQWSVFTAATMYPHPRKATMTLSCPTELSYSDGEKYGDLIRSFIVFPSTVRKKYKSVVRAFGVGTRVGTVPTTFAILGKASSDIHTSLTSNDAIDMAEAHMCSCLPPELECKIFRLAALSRPASTPALMRVAWRVKQWVEPLLYRTLVIGVDVIDGLPACDMPTFNRIIQTKSPAFLADGVRNVMLRYQDAHQAHAILSACPGIENLYLTCPFRHPMHPTLHDPTLPVVDVPSLRQLYCILDDIFNLHSVDPFTHTTLAHITHLEPFDDPSTIERRHGPMRDIPLGTRLSVLPHLTHLALSLDHAIIWVCVRVLAECKCLRVLVVFCEPGGQELEEARHAGLEVLASDVRGVMMSQRNYVTDWQHGILTGNDYWAQAEALIAKRISGEVDHEAAKLLDTPLDDFDVELDARDDKGVAELNATVDSAATPEAWNDEGKELLDDNARHARRWYRAAATVYRQLDNIECEGVRLLARNENEALLDREADAELLRALDATD
ncbi:hypothetical protein GGX14DRAFT_652523 [Mycena pura]|uniref:Uncharacterized protein n=1 Tax=Mycena pura TaxID=153505 RepID=A0AAD6V571_9AGAR|nr:hypothetical protein GGX14DRAFT_652523 [Mycena pura]